MLVTICDTKVVQIMKDLKGFSKNLLTVLTTYIYIM